MNLASLTTALLHEHDRTQRTTTLTHVADLMHHKGASPHSLHLALTGFNAFLTSTRTPRHAAALSTDQPEASTIPACPLHEPAIPLSEISIQPLRWLWKDYIPVGKLTLLDGEPGTGTSLLALSLAACVSSGTPLSPSSPAQQGTVILIAPCDDASDTLKPRLLAAGGNPDHVHLLNTVESLDTTHVLLRDRPFSLVQDLDLLEATIQRTQAVLVIIDPLQAVLGRGTFNATALAQLAERTHCAILLVRPLTTARTNLQRPRPTGSPALVAAARSCLLLAADPAGEQQSLLIPTKTTLCARPPILTYQVIPDEQDVPLIQWLGPRLEPLSPSTNPYPGAALSLQRQAILRCLQDSPTPRAARDLAADTGYNYECVRKTLLRMLHSGELVSPARGLYTTSSHPCLTNTPTEPIPTPSETPVPTIPTHDTPFNDVLPEIAIPTFPNHQSATMDYPREIRVPTILTNDTPFNHVPPETSVPNFPTHDTPFNNVPREIAALLAPINHNALSDCSPETIIPTNDNPINDIPPETPVPTIPTPELDTLTNNPHPPYPFLELAERC